MKYILVILLVSISFIGNAQNSIAPIHDTIDKVLTEVDAKPVYTGGRKALLAYLDKNLQYPAKAKKFGIQGIVNVSAVVEKSGALSDIMVMQFNPDLDEEAIRLVSQMPKWRPAKIDGQLVRCKTIIAIKFKLPDVASLDVKLNKPEPPAFTKDGKDTIYDETYVEELSHFVGYKKAQQKYIDANLVNPAGVTGGVKYVTVKFVVDTFGKLKDIETELKGDKELDKEAMRLVKAMPDWVPAQLNGKKVRSTASVGMKFTLNNPSPNDKSVAAENTTYAVVEQMPDYPGGQKALMTYLATNTLYPEYCRKNQISGTVYVQFVVSKTGDVTEVAIARGIQHDLDAEAMRVVSRMPQWKPGSQGGKPVSVYYTVPIKFKL